jgi:hypothetical protein
MALTANWNYPTVVRLGPGRIGELVEACAMSGIKKPLLVSGARMCGPVRSRSSKISLRI